MELEIVKFETAKLLKDVGFDADSDNYYDNESDPNVFELQYFHCDRNYKDHDGYPEDLLYFAPTQALVQQWLRETHELEIYIEPMWEDETKVKTVYSPWVLWSKEDESEDEDPEFFDTYEEALESAILEAIETIKTK